MNKFQDYNIKTNPNLKLDNKIKTLNQFNNKFDLTYSSQISQIINTKSAFNSLKFDSKLNCNKNLTVATFLKPNNSKENINPLSKILQMEVKQFNVNRNPLFLSFFKNMIKQDIDNNLKKFSNIRQMLNLITKFEFKLSNSNYNLYNFNKKTNFIQNMQKASKFLTLNFLSKGCYISKPSFNIVLTNKNTDTNINNRLNSNIPTKKININLFYYIKTTEIYSQSLLNNTILSNLFDTKFSYLTDYLTKLFNAEIELNLVRIYQPYQEPTILVQYLNSESYDNKFIRIVTRLFKNINFNNVKNSNLSLNKDLISSNNSYPSNISGLNIKLAGRPLNERIIPRLTVKRAQKGNFNRLNAKLIEKSIFTDKTRKGAFSFTVTLTQNFK